MNTVLVESLEKGFEKFEKNVKKSALRILRILKQNNKAVEIYLIGNGKMRKLNREFRGKDKTTNILSFEEPAEFFSIKSNKKKLGEIYLNIFLTKEGGRGENLFSIDELVAHGILHLMGYNHIKKADRIKMERREKNLISNL